MNKLKYKILISIWINLIVLNYIVFSGNIHMDTFEFVLWSIFCGTLSMLIGLIIYRYIELKLDNKKRGRITHKKDLIDKDSSCEDCYYKLPENQMENIDANPKIKINYNDIRCKFNKKY